MPYHPREEFKKLADEVRSSGQSQSMTVRQLLRYFYQERRSNQVIPWIRQNLVGLGLECTPDFEHVFIDSPVVIRKKPTVKAMKGAEVQTVEVREQRDPVQRLALLPSANRPPVSVTRDAELQTAITLMMMHDYSQLPVMQNERNVDGIVSWRSIVSARCAGRECLTVRECLVRDIQVLSHDTPLFDAVKTVMKYEVVLVKSAEQKITGLVTIADIGEQFVALSESFLTLEQIENHLRSLLDAKFTAEQLKHAIDPGDDDREVESIADLTFGEIIRLLENPEHWQQISLALDRATLTKRLDQVRRIRNDVMHFHPDGISPDDVEILRETGRFFYNFSQFKPH